MEHIWFDWRTNPDYWDMLRRPEVRTANMIKRAEEKRALARKKEKRKETEKIKTLNKNNLPLLSKYHLFHNSIQ